MACSVCRKIGHIKRYCPTDRVNNLRRARTNNQLNPNHPWKNDALILMLLERIDDLELELKQKSS